MCRLPPRSVTAKYWDILLYPTDRPPIGGLLCCTQWRKEAGSRLAAAGKRGRARAHELEIEHTYETHRHTQPKVSIIMQRAKKNCRICGTLSLHDVDSLQQGAECWIRIQNGHSRHCKAYRNCCRSLRERTLHQCLYS